MTHAKGLSDFVLTGCAIVPLIAVVFDHPELALLSHIVLLFSALLFAGNEDDAPLKQADCYTRQRKSQPGAAKERQSAKGHTASHRSLPLQGRPDAQRKYLRRTSSVHGDLDET